MHPLRERCVADADQQRLHDTRAAAGIAVHNAGQAVEANRQY